MEIVRQQQRIVNTLVTSIAKIDDKLIGNILGNSGRSQFVNDDTFYLTPNVDPTPNDTNCVRDMIYKDGRWLHLEDKTACSNFTNATAIELTDHIELWIPEVADEAPIGTADHFEGWSYFANERKQISNAIEFTSNAQTTTSVSDLMDYPKGALNATLYGFFMAHLTLFALIIGGAIIYWRGRRAEIPQIAIHAMPFNEVRANNNHVINVNNHTGHNAASNTNAVVNNPSPTAPAHFDNLTGHHTAFNPNAVVNPTPSAPAHFENQSEQHAYPNTHAVIPAPIVPAQQPQQKRNYPTTFPGLHIN